MILAAGESRRMGQPKLLLPLEGRTIIEMVMTNILQSRIDGILVVLGSNAEKIGERIKDFPVKETVNPHFQEGMLSSIQWGFECLPKNTRAALVILGDQPSIPSSVVDQIIEAHQDTAKGIVLPVYEGKRGHPLLIDMKYRDDVKRLSPEIGLRQLVYDHEQDLLEIEVNTPCILRDIDTLEDYRKEIEYGR